MDGQVDQVINNVSRFALMKVYHMVCTGFNDISAICRGQIKVSLGLPCPHQLRARVAAHGTLQLFDFHVQRHLDPPLPLRFPLLHSDQVEEEKAPPSGLITLLNSVAEVYPTLGSNQQTETENVLLKLVYQRFRAPNEPQIQQTRGRSPGAMNQTQSQSSTKREPSLHEIVHRRCKRCSQNGHNIRTCVEQ